MILGIETSCDETGIALVEAKGGLRAPRFKVLKNFVASQIKIHAPFGGVVPNLAKREHLKNLPLLLKKLTANELKAIKLISVTVGPGLEPALWTGINFAQELCSKLKASAESGLASGGKNPKLKIVGANHLEGHLYSFLLPNSYSNILKNIRIRNLFPAIALIVSGGHTILLLMESFSKWKKLGETRDDAAGEAFDKVARMLNLPYPGGPEIEKFAHKGNSDVIPLPRPMMTQKNYDFSFSGLKTSALYHLRDNPKANKADVAASFQKAAIEVLVAKTIRAAKEFDAGSVLLSGGVAANKSLRKNLRAAANKIGARFLVPDFKYNLDNAAMIAVAGYFANLRKKNYKLMAQGDLSV